MDDDSTTIADLKRLVLAFSVERDWVQFHQPKDLGIALASEVGELLDLFRFRSDRQIQAILETPSGRAALSHEMADCLWALLRLADVCGVDLASSLADKVRLAGLKYPADRSYGRNDKYTAYRSGPAAGDDLPPPG